MKSTGRVLSISVVLAAAALLSSVCGCGYRIDWPDMPKRVERNAEAETRCYAIDSKGRINYRQYLVDGRIVRLEFDDNADGTPEETVDFIAKHDEWPQFLIVLDGVPFDVAERLYAEGRFRLFEPPRRVVSVYPAMTDLALSRLFGTPPCAAYESRYFDRQRNTMAGGNADYIEGKNAPWIADVDYAAPQNVAVGTYLNPHSVFDRELQAMYKLFRTHKGPFASAYSVGSAGLGTRGGEAAIRAYLIQIDRLCERITYERRGRVRFSVTADHGHGLQRCRRISLKDALRKAGFNPSESIKGQKDVVQPEYGLVTFAQFFTSSPAEVAAALDGQSSVDIVSFVENDCIVVLKKGQRAEIRKGAHGFVYRPISGDPLGLVPLIETMREAGLVTEDGEINDGRFLQMSADEAYPDALRRLWDCHHRLVEQPADVVVSLKPGFCVGSKFFDFFVGPVASTHGALDRLSSVTFLLTNRSTSKAAQVLRVGDVVRSIRD